MWILYQAALALALLAAAPVLLARRGRHYLPTLAGRLGRAPGGGAAIAGGRVRSGCTRCRWARSAVAATLVRALPADLPLLVTTVTPTGQARARAELGGRAAVAYLPFDLGFAVARFFRRHHPRGLILVEGDYWPLLLRAGRRRGLPAVVVNGRVGDAQLPPHAPAATLPRPAVRPGRPLRRADRRGPRPARRPGRGRRQGEGHRQPQVRHPGAAANPELAAPPGRASPTAGRCWWPAPRWPGEEGQVLAAFAGAGGGERGPAGPGAPPPRAVRRGRRPCSPPGALPFRRRSALAGAPASDAARRPPARRSSSSTPWASWPASTATPPPPSSAAPWCPPAATTRSSRRASACRWRRGRR